jgi:hypothetical protein
MRDDEKLRLEGLVGRELKRLPDLHAPETLFHRVMLEVHTRARQPWWQRSWHGWPPALQAITLVMLLALATGVSYWLSATLREIPYEILEGTFREWLGPLAQLWALGETLVNAVWLVMKSGGQQVMLYGSLLILAGYGACIGLGAAFARAFLCRAENGRL